MINVLRSARLLGPLAALTVAGTLTTRTIDISPGDTLSELAATHDVTVAELVEWNDIADPDFILAGDTLIVELDAGEGSARRYVVRAGDSLSILARRFETTVAVLAQANQLSDPDLILAGQPLRLTAAPGTALDPQPGSTTYVVALGDTLSAIARALGLSTTDLADVNEIEDPDRIIEGQTLRVPSSSAPPAPTTTAPPPTTTPPPPPPPTTAPTTTTPSSTTAPPPSTSTTVPGPSAATPNPGTSAGLAPYFERWAAAYGVDRSLLEAVLWAESGWRPDLVGPAGQVGLGQLSPDTVVFIEERLLGLDLEPLDTSDGIQLAARYLRYLVDRTVDERTAVAAWRQGLSAVTRDGVSAAGGEFADHVLAIRAERS